MRKIMHGKYGKSNMQDVEGLVWKCGLMLCSQELKYFLCWGIVKHSFIWKILYVKYRKCGREWRKDFFLFYDTHHILFMVIWHQSYWKRTTEDTHCCHYMGYFFYLAARVLLYAIHRIIHTTTFVTPVVEHQLELEIAQCVHHEGSIRLPIAPWADTLPWIYISSITPVLLHIHEVNGIFCQWVFKTDGK